MAAVRAAVPRGHLTGVRPVGVVEFLTGLQEAVGMPCSGGCRAVAACADGELGAGGSDCNTNIVDRAADIGNGAPRASTPAPRRSCAGCAAEPAPASSAPP